MALLRTFWFPPTPGDVETTSTSGESRRIGAERSHPPRGYGPIRGSGEAGRRARVYDGKSGNRTSREVSVKVQRYGVTNIIVASP